MHETMVAHKLHYYTYNSVSFEQGCNEKFAGKFIEYINLDDCFPKHLDDPSTIS
jgi:hypothetical protein